MGTFLVLVEDFQALDTDFFMEVCLGGDLGSSDIGLGTSWDWVQTDHNPIILKVASYGTTLTTQMQCCELSTNN
jgi:hypothetical protein